MSRPAYQPTARRLCAGIGVGLLVGALLFLPLGIAVVLSLENDEPSWPWHGLMLVTAFTLMCSMFLVGGFLTGAPIWAVLHRMGKQRWYDAALTGFIATFALVQIFFALASGLSSAAAAAAAGMIGAISWLTAWRVAYPEDRSQTPHHDAHQPPVE